MKTTRARSWVALSALLAASIGSVLVVTAPAQASVFASISAGGRFTCGITPAGAVRCWGENTSGQLGNGSTTPSNIPVQVTGITSGATAVSAGLEHACAIVAGGVKCWGNNVYRQLGDGSSVASSSVPVQATGLTSGITAISSGENHACAVQAGAAKCWGNNSFSQLGDGSAGFASSGPVAVTGLAAATTLISAGSRSTCAVQSGAAKCWGDNFSGQLGDASNITRSTPVQVATLTTGVTAITVGDSHACALAASVTCWGRNAEGQLGNGGNAATNAPVVVPGLSSVSGLSANGNVACVVTAGAAKCWGGNAYSQLGNGGAANSNVPVAVVGLASGVTMVSVGSFHACAVVSGGSRCWGNGLYGQLGDGGASNSNVPVSVTNGVVAYAGVDLLSPTSLRVRWTDTSQTEAGYYVYRATAGAAAVLVPGCSTTTPNLTECTDTGLTPGTYYQYYVYSWNADGTSMYPGTYLVTRTPTTAPAAPTITYVFASGATSARVGWVDNSANESGFRIYRLVSNAWQLATTAPADATAATVTDAAMNTNDVQVFRVSSFNAGGETDGESYVYSVVRYAPVGPAPSYVGASGVGGTSATITWADNATNETGYRLYRADSVGQVVVAGCSDTTPNLTSCVDTGLTPGAFYRYWVFALVPGGGQTGDPGTGLWVHTPSPLPAPVITDAAGATATTITLHWADGAADETGYSVMEYVGGTFVERASLGANTTTATLNGLTPATVHVYYVVVKRGTEQRYSAYGIWAATTA